MSSSGPGTLQFLQGSGTEARYKQSYFKINFSLKVSSLWNRNFKFAKINRISRKIQSNCENFSNGFSLTEDSFEKHESFKHKRVRNFMALHIDIVYHLSCHCFGQFIHWTFMNRKCNNKFIEIFFLFPFFCSKLSVLATHVLMNCWLAYR